MRRIVSCLMSLGPGCACPALPEVPVHDPDGLARPGQLADIRAALADFQRWTDGTGVCVPAVRITEQADLEGALGRWDGDGRPLRVGGDLAWPYGTVVHELCHAWDEGAGFESEWHPDLFRAEDVDERVDYPSRGQRVHESFARTCEDGPRDLRLAVDLAERCGLELDAGADRFVGTAVYGPETARRAPAAVGALGLTRVPLDGLLGDLRVLDAVAGGGRVWVLALRPRPFSPLQPQQVQTVLLGIDPDTGHQVTGALLRRDPEDQRRFRLVAGTPAPLLVEEGPGETWISPLDLESGRPGEARALGAAVRWEGAVRVGDTLWATGLDIGGEAGLATLDLETGAVAPAPLDPPWPSWRRVFGGPLLAADGTLVLGGYTERLGVGALRVDPTTGRWTSLPLPDGAEPARLAPLPDGRLVTALSWYPGPDRLRMLAVVDGAGGVAAAAGCEADRIAHSVRFLPSAEGLWLLEDAREVDGVAWGRWLTRIDPD